MELFEAMERFLEDPTHAAWLLDEGLWPDSNTGCNGLALQIMND